MDPVDRLIRPRETEHSLTVPRSGRGSIAARGGNWIAVRIGDRGSQSPAIGTVIIPWVGHRGLTASSNPVARSNTPSLAVRLLVVLCSQGEFLNRAGGPGRLVAGAGPLACSLLMGDASAGALAMIQMRTGTWKPDPVKTAPSLPGRAGFGPRARAGAGGYRATAREFAHA